MRTLAVAALVAGLAGLSGLAQAQDKKADPTGAKEAAESEEAAEAGASAPTASKESAGIGPQSIETNRVVGAQEGPKQTLTTGDGSKRPVRIIAPNLIPVPEMRQ